jgi:hypothetical protein
LESGRATGKPLGDEKGSRKRDGFLVFDSFDRIMKSHEIRLSALQIVIDILDGNLSPRLAPK